MDPHVAQPDAPATSPDGRYVLSLLTGRDPTGAFLRVQVAEVGAGGASAVFTSDELWYTRHRTVVGWGDLGGVWVYSGDVGVTVYTEDPPGTWTGRTWKAGAPGAPDWLRDAAPMLFR